MDETKNLPVAVEFKAIETLLRLLKAVWCACGVHVECVVRMVHVWSVWCVGPYSRTVRCTAHHVSRRLGASDFEWESRDNALESVGSEHTIVISAMSSIR